MSGSLCARRAILIGMRGAFPARLARVANRLGINGKRNKNTTVIQLLKFKLDRFIKCQQFQKERALPELGSA